MSKSDTVPGIEPWTDLPPVPDTFAGRRKEQAALVELIEAGRVAVVRAARGRRGVGLTTVAAAAARDAGQMEGGWLYADLRDVDGRPGPIQRRWMMACGESPPITGGAVALVDATRAALAARAEHRGRTGLMIDGIRRGWISAVESLLALKPQDSPVILVESEAKSVPDEMFDEAVRIPKMSVIEGLVLIRQVAKDSFNQDAVVVLNDRADRVPLTLDLVARGLAQGSHVGLLEGAADEAIADEDTLDMLGQPRFAAAVMLSHLTACTPGARKLFRAQGCFASGPIHLRHRATALLMDPEEVHRQAEELVRRGLWRRVSADCWRVPSQLHDWAGRLADEMVESDDLNDLRVSWILDELARLPTDLADAIAVIDAVIPDTVPAMESAGRTHDVEALEEMAQVLLEGRIGRWLISACPEVAMRLGQLVGSELDSTDGHSRGATARVQVAVGRKSGVVDVQTARKAAEQALQWVETGREEAAATADQRVMEIRSELDDLDRHVHRLAGRLERESEVGSEVDRLGRELLDLSARAEHLCGVIRHCIDDVAREVGVELEDEEHTELFTPVDDDSPTMVMDIKSVFELEAALDSAQSAKERLSEALDGLRARRDALSNQVRVNEEAGWEPLLERLQTSLDHLVALSSDSPLAEVREVCDQAEWALGAFGSEADDVEAEHRAAIAREVRASAVVDQIGEVAAEIANARSHELNEIRQEDRSVEGIAAAMKGLEDALASINERLEDAAEAVEASGDLDGVETVAASLVEIRAAIKVAAESYRSDVAGAMDRVAEERAAAAARDAAEADLIAARAEIGSLLDVQLDFVDKPRNPPILDDAPDGQRAASEAFDAAIQVATEAQESVTAVRGRLAAAVAGPDVRALYEDAKSAADAVTEAQGSLNDALQTLNEANDRWASARADEVRRAVLSEVSETALRQVESAAERLASLRTGLERLVAVDPDALLLERAQQALAGLEPLLGDLEQAKSLAEGIEDSETAEDGEVALQFVAATLEGFLESLEGEVEPVSSMADSEKKDAAFRLQALMLSTCRARRDAASNDILVLVKQAELFTGVVASGLQTSEAVDQVLLELHGLAEEIEEVEFTNGTEEAVLTNEMLVELVERAEESRRSLDSAVQGAREQALAHFATETERLVHERSQAEERAELDVAAARERATGWPTAKERLARMDVAWMALRTIAAEVPREDDYTDVLDVGRAAFEAASELADRTLRAASEVQELCMALSDEVAASRAQAIDDVAAQHDLVSKAVAALVDQSGSAIDDKRDLVADWLDDGVVAAAWHVVAVAKGQLDEMLVAVQTPTEAPQSAGEAWFVIRSSELVDHQSGAGHLAHAVDEGIGAIEHGVSEAENRAVMTLRSEMSRLVDEVGGWAGEVSRWSQSGRGELAGVDGVGLEEALVVVESAPDRIGDHQTALSSVGDLIEGCSELDAVRDLVATAAEHHRAAHLVHQQSAKALESLRSGVQGAVRDAFAAGKARMVAAVAAAEVAVDHLQTSLADAAVEDQLLVDVELAAAHSVMLEAAEEVYDASDAVHGAARRVARTASMTAALKEVEAASAVVEGLEERVQLVRDAAARVVTLRADAEGRIVDSSVVSAVARVGDLDSRFDRILSVVSAAVNRVEGWGLDPVIAAAEAVGAFQGRVSEFRDQATKLVSGASEVAGLTALRAFEEQVAALEEQAAAAVEDVDVANRELTRTLAESRDDQSEHLIAAVTEVASAAEQAQMLVTIQVETALEASEPYAEILLTQRGELAAMLSLAVEAVSIRQRLLDTASAEVSIAKLSQLGDEARALPKLDVMVERAEVAVAELQGLVAERDALVADRLRLGGDLYDALIVAQHALADAKDVVELARPTAGESRSRSIRDRFVALVTLMDEMEAKLDAASQALVEVEGSEDLDVAQALVKEHSEIAKEVVPAISCVADEVAQIVELDRDLHSRMSLVAELPERVRAAEIRRRGCGVVANQRVDTLVKLAAETGELSARQAASRARSIAARVAESVDVLAVTADWMANEEDPETLAQLSDVGAAAAEQIDVGLAAVRAEVAGALVSVSEASMARVRDSRSRAAQRTEQVRRERGVVHRTRQHLLAWRRRGLRWTSEWSHLDVDNALDEFKEAADSLQMGIAAADEAIDGLALGGSQELVAEAQTALVTLESVAARKLDAVGTAVVSAREEAVAEVDRWRIRHEDIRAATNRLSAFMQSGNAAARVPLYQQGLRLARRTGDRAEEARWLTDLGDTYRELGKVDVALTHYEDALVALRELEHHPSVVRVLAKLGDLYRLRSDPDRAVGLLEEARKLADKHGISGHDSDLLDALADARVAQGELEEAEALFRQALASALEREDRHDVIVQMINDGRVLSAMGRRADAMGRFEEAAGAARRCGFRGGFAASAALVAETVMDSEPALARLWAEQAVEMAEGEPDRDAHATYMGVYCQTLIRDGRPGAAADVALRALSMAESKNDRLLGYLRAQLAEARWAAARAQRTVGPEMALVTSELAFQRVLHRRPVGGLVASGPDPAGANDAVNAMKRAVAHARSSGDQVRAARRQFHLGRAMQQSGNARGAVAMSEAVKRLQELGDSGAESARLILESGE